MSQQIEETLLQAIKKDDIKAFDALMETTQCGAYRLGRFPVLSLMYLYKSRKLISAYESMFLKTTNSVTLSEPAEVSKKFSAKAGKCLRLYFNEVVSPLEMLLILDDTKRLKRVYPTLNLSSAVKGRLKSIYFIKYSLNIKFEGNEIIIERRPLNYREKKKIAAVCISVILVIAIVVSSSVISSVFAPVRLDKYYDLTSDETFTLDQDFYVTKNHSIEEFNCTIVGNGHKIVFDKGATIKNFNGNISDVTIESAGEAVFAFVSENAKIENVTFNVIADISTSEAAAFVATTNYGVIENVTVNVSGKINALAKSDNVTEELTFGGVVLQNYVRNNNVVGTIKNCVVNYSQFSLVGEASANAVFGGVAGVNNGYLQDCKVSGDITADTFDVAGICSQNEGVISNNVNEANLIQNSSDTGWNPIVSGIVLNNGYLVQNCQNKGNLSAYSNCQKEDITQEKAPTVSASGIAYINRGGIENCQNVGSVTAKGIGDAYVGGISAQSISGISYCLSSGGITVTAKDAFVGGICGTNEVAIYGYTVYFGATENCISQSKINVVAIDESNAYAGGIVGYVREIEFKGVDSTLYFGGRVTDCYFIGECVSQVDYFGNVVGVCGSNVYQSNSYTVSDGTDRANFDGNYYLNNSSKAFGATVADGEFAEVEDKGAMRATIDEILNSEAYKSILKKVN